MPAPLRFVPPMECLEVDQIPEGDLWQYELKLDGYRTIAVKQNGEVELFSRNGTSFNSKFPSVVQALETVRIKRFILDGEIVALDEKGRHSFALLQKFKTSKLKLRFYIFDLLHIDNQSFARKILEKRRKRLESEFATLPETVQLSPILTGQAHDVLTHVKEFEFEGVIAKRLDSFYFPGKTSDNWQKQKTQRSDDFLVGGYVPGRYGIEELVVGERRNGGLCFVGSIKMALSPPRVRRFSMRYKAKKSRKVPL